MDRAFDVPARAEMEAALVEFATRGGIRVRYGCEWLSTRRDDAGFVLGHVGRRVPLPGVCVRHWSDRAVGRPDSRARGGAALRRDGRARALPGQERLHRRQEELGVRARTGPAALGATHRARLAAPGGHCDARVLTAQPSVPLAVFRAPPRRHRELRRRRGDRARGAPRGRVSHPCERDDVGGRARARERRGHRSDRASVRRCATCRAWALRWSTTVGCRRRRRTGRASRSRGSTSRATSPRLRPAYASTVRRAAPAPSTGSATTPASSRGTSQRSTSGFARERRALDRDEVVPHLLRELAHAPELWTQKGYLARVVDIDGADGIRDEGIVPLAAFVDRGGGDACAVAVEYDADGDDHPGRVRPAGRPSGGAFAPSASAAHVRHRRASSAARRVPVAAPGLTWSGAAALHGGVPLLGRLATIPHELP